MARATKPENAMTFVGPPRHLRLVSGASDVSDGEFLADETLQPHLEGFRLAAPRRGEHGPRARLRLSPFAPPGEYTAALRVDGTSRPVKVTVQRAPRLSVTPASLRFEGAPGSEIVETLVVSNRGNVAARLPERVVVGIFDDDGLEAAFAETYRADPKGTDAIVQTFFGRLRDAHGGLLRLTLRSPDRLVPPGATVAAHLAGRLPSAVKPGHSYHGVWSFDVINVALSIAVVGERSP